MLCNDVSAASESFDALKINKDQVQLFDQLCLNIQFVPHFFRFGKLSCVPAGSSKLLVTLLICWIIWVYYQSSLPLFLPWMSLATDSLITLHHSLHRLQQFYSFQLGSKCISLACIHHVAPACSVVLQMYFQT